MINLSSHAYSEASNALAQVIMRDDASAEDVQGAIQGLASAISDELRDSYESASGDRTALASRGFKVLTSEENAYFTTFAKAALNSRTMAEFADLTTGANLPQQLLVLLLPRDLVREVKRCVLRADGEVGHWILRGSRC